VEVCSHCKFFNSYTP